MAEFGRYSLGCSYSAVCYRWFFWGEMENASQFSHRQVLCTCRHCCALGVGISLILQSFQQAAQSSKKKALLCLKLGSFPACREECSSAPLGIFLCHLHPCIIFPPSLTPLLYVHKCTTSSLPAAGASWNHRIILGGKTH